MSTALPRLYTDLAPWFHLLTAPDEYAEEAAFYQRTLTAAAATPPRTLLELGSGGGNMASHYKRHFTSTLVDLSPGMLALSQTINPECEHLQGDMRSVRLGRQFDAVLVHDAVIYLTTAADLREAMTTAFVHCRPGGVVLFAPDCVRETFRPQTDHGGHDGATRSLRYLEWTRDADPTDSTYEVDFVYVMHERGRPLRVEHETHTEGLFARADWLQWLTDAGFRVSITPLEHSEIEPGTQDVFVAVRALA